MQLSMPTHSVQALILLPKTSSWMKKILTRSMVESHSCYVLARFIAVSSTYRSDCKVRIVTQDFAAQIVNVGQIVPVYIYLVYLLH